MLIEKKDFFLGTKFILLTFLKILIATNLIKNIVFGPTIHFIWEKVNFPVFLNFSHKSSLSCCVQEFIFTTHQGKGLDDFKTNKPRYT